MKLESIYLDAARHHAARPAVVGSDLTLTYGELDRLANRIGRALLDSGVQAGDRVGIWMDKSPVVVAAMQAILRIGAAYVPVDPMSPVERVRKIVRDCDMRSVVTHRARAEQLCVDELAELPVLMMDELDLELWSADPLVEQPDRANELAYILYTSGSTGTPKGVCISHENALAFIRWSVDAVGATVTDRFSNHAPFHFDLSVFDLYVAASVGASVAIVPEPVSYIPKKLVRFMREQKISVWYSVPSALVLMMEHGGLLEAELPDLHTIVFAGEPFPIRHLRRLRSGFLSVRLHNFYGPTETNVCTAYEVIHLSDDATSIPIGTPASYDRMWVEKAEGGLAGLGEEGELIVEGPTVMMGYWGAPRLSPRRYPTGDIVRVREDGGYDYLGRRDHMVKVRGHRVELGEVEAALESHPLVRQAAVLCEGTGLSARLVAFLVPRSDTRPNLIELKRYSAERLPRYMIVDQVSYLDELPRTRNGKLDRRHLADLRLIGVQERALPCNGTESSTN